jgi:NAD(P)-dependent dehydrogenase (short-subunit alcohol dehydrogenase family)
MRLSNTVAVVTGGGSGIGRAICERFAREGARIVAADLRPERAEETAARIVASGGDAIGLPVDVARADSVAAMARSALERYERVDILVNNAGLSVGNDILEISEEQWDLNLDVVLKGVYLCSRAFLPGMLERRRGVILNISSVNGLIAVGEAAYSAAKAGMINLTQNMAIRYGDRGVRVNCIAPGTIRTPIWGERLAKDPHVFDKLAKWYPLGRVGEPDDVASAAVFLCSDEASWITGVTLPVDGGLTAGQFRMVSELQGEG